MMRTIQLAVACVAALVASAGQLQAGIIMASTSATDWDPTPIQDTLDDLTLTLAGLPTATSSDLSVTFRVRADLNDPSENVTMSIDGYSFGIWLNDVLGDDTIADSVGDSGGPFSNQSFATFTGTAIIPQAIFAGLIADGQLAALFNFSSDVADLAPPALNGFELPEFAEFSISYSDSASAVPEPSSLAILGIGAGVMGLVSIRRRREQKQAATS